MPVIFGDTRRYRRQIFWLPLFLFVFTLPTALQASVEQLTYLDKIKSSKFDKMLSHSGKIKRIEITVVSKIRFSNKFILTVVLIYDNNESQYIFESDKRLSEDELTVLRDMEKIYEALRKVKVLDDVEIVKVIV